jgi:transposase
MCVVVPEDSMPQRGYQRSQTYLLPPATDDWIPANHPVRYIAMFVDELPDREWAALDIAQEPDARGAPRYAPELLLSLWLAGFTFGIRTTRKLETACQYDLAFIWLAGGQRPDHHTLWAFYARHRQAMRRLLKQTVRVAIAANLLDLGLQAIDGTKVLANAARERSLTEAELQHLEQRLDRELAELEAQHAGAGEPTPAVLPPELASATALRERVRQARAQMETTGQAGKGNLTDPEARVMKTRQGLRPAYNAQAAAVVALDRAHSGQAGRMIVAAELSTEPDDHGQLLPMLAAGADQAPVPLTVADAGYHSGANLAACAEAGYPVVIPEPRARGDQQPSRSFTYDAATDTYQCSQGVVLTRRGTTTRGDDGREVRRYRADGRSCRGCPLRAHCIGAGRGGRVLQVGLHDLHLRQHRAWMETEEARQVLGRRKGLIEGVFGTIKAQFAGRQLWLRGQAKVAAEWSLLAIGANLRTLARIWAAGGAAVVTAPA